MDAQQVFTHGQQGLYLLLMVSAPVLITVLAVGLIVSIFQAATQIHEATLSFVPKMIAAVAVLVDSGHSPNVYVDDRLFVERHTEYSRMYAEFQHLPVEEVGDLAAWLERPPTKLVAVADPVDVPALREALLASFAEESTASPDELLAPQMT